ncbi:MAG: glycosyltransferase [Gemmatimonadetes bacterium]|nr:glycosyltransferase [Gemmatimonadota bacterium]
MKVLHIIAGLDQGGGESALYRLVTDRSRSTEHVVISMMDLGVYGPLLAVAGVRVHTLHMPRGLLALRGIARLWKIIRSERPDVVQTWMYHADLVGGLVARVAGCSAIVWGVYSFNLAPGMMSTRTRAVIRVASMLSGLLPRRIISCSSAAIAVHGQMGYDTSRFRTVHLGYDSDSAHRDSAAGRRFRREHGIGDRDVLIGCVARWDPQKDHLSFLRALRIVAPAHSFKCVLVGPGMTKANLALAEQIEETGTADRVVLAGQVDDIGAAMSALDLHVLSSLGEAFPNVLCEAMLHEVPCVATDVGDVSVILGETGWLVPAGNVTAMAAAIDTAICGMRDRTAWSLRGVACRRRIVDHFSLERMVDGYHVVWAESLEGAGR